MVYLVSTGLRYLVTPQTVRQFFSSQVLLSLVKVFAHKLVLL